MFIELQLLILNLVTNFMNKPLQKRIFQNESFVKNTLTSNGRQPLSNLNATIVHEVPGNRFRQEIRLSIDNNFSQLPAAKDNWEQFKQELDAKKRAQLCGKNSIK